MNANGDRHILGYFPGIVINLNYPGLLLQNIARLVECLFKKRTPNGNQYINLTREFAAKFLGAAFKAKALPLPAPTAKPAPPTPAPPLPTPRPRAYVIEDPRIPGKGEVGPRCGYVLTDDDLVYLWEAYCYSNEPTNNATLIID